MHTKGVYSYIERVRDPYFLPDKNITYVGYEAALTVFHNYILPFMGFAISSMRFLWSCKINLIWFINVSGKSFNYRIEICLPIKKACTKLRQWLFAEMVWHITPALG